jgi:hypothetical protein
MLRIRAARAARQGAEESRCSSQNISRGHATRTRLRAFEFGKRRTAMSTDKPTAEDLDAVAGTEDEQGIIQPSVDEILDPDPEHGELPDEDAEIDDIDDEDMDAEEEA